MQDLNPNVEARHEWTIAISISSARHVPAVVEHATIGVLGGGFVVLSLQHETVPYVVDVDAPDAAAAIKTAAAPVDRPMSGSSDTSRAHSSQRACRDGRSRGDEAAPGAGLCLCAWTCADGRCGPPAGPRHDPAKGRPRMTTPRDDRDLRGPAQLMPPRVPVVRLNRRLLYVIGGALVIVVVTGLAALRAQGSRLQEAGPARASQFSPPAGGRWFDKIPDREPTASPVMKQIDMPLPSPPPAVTPPSPTAPAPKALTEAELETQRRERAFRTAMSAPIGVTGSRPAR
jgi:hypothetical protein